MLNTKPYAYNNIHTQEAFNFITKTWTWLIFISTLYNIIQYPKRDKMMDKGRWNLYLYVHQMVYDTYVQGVQYIPI